MKNRPLAWLASMGLLALAGCGSPASAPMAAPRVRVVWTFEPPERGAIISTPWVDAEHVFVGAVQDRGFTASGAVYCLERRTGKRVWKFTDDGALLHMYSSPFVAEGRLFIGEGMHANLICKLHCLDAGTGRKLWHHEARGHIESSPRVSGGRVYFGAGDDGLWCLDAESGKVRWHFREPAHIDSNPWVDEDRVWVGSGVSRLHRNTEAFCLASPNGQVLWRVPFDLPVWGSPTVAGDRVCFGLGNGRLLQSAPPPDKPAGAVVCLDARSGIRLWRYDVPDGVLAQPAVAEGHVYFGARDGCCYAVDIQEGRLRWKANLGSPIVTRPAWSNDRLYVSASDGQVACLQASSGAMLWTFDVARQAMAARDGVADDPRRSRELLSHMNARLLASPVVVEEDDEGRTHRRIWIGAELQGQVHSTAALFCLED